MKTQQFLESLDKSKFWKNPINDEGYAACDFCEAGRQQSDTTYQDGENTCCIDHYQKIPNSSEKVYDGYIIGTPSEGRKLFLVNWYYMANFGSCMVWAKDEKEAHNNHLYGKRKDVMFQITEVNPESMPVLFNYGSRKRDD